MVHAGEKSAPGRKISKERITFLTCTNGTGTHKLQLLVIGKSKNPRCFKGFKNPINYANSKTAWMTASIFKNWFEKNFVPEVKKFQRDNNLPPKALLLLDNAPCHPPASELVSNDGSICTIYMPPNVTALIQPMDQNAIRLTKLKYRNLLLQHIVGTSSDVIDVLKNINLKDAIMYLNESWDFISRPIIEKCWQNVKLDEIEEFDIEDNQPLAQLRENFEIQVVRQTTDLLNQILPEVST